MSECFLCRVVRPPFDNIVPYNNNKGLLRDHVDPSLSKEHPPLFARGRSIRIPSASFVE